MASKKKIIKIEIDLGKSIRRLAREEILHTWFRKAGPHSSKKYNRKSQKEKDRRQLEHPDD